MTKLADWHWRIDESEEPEGKSFNLIGAKGRVNSYPTVPLMFPGEFYTRDEALLNAKAAAAAPQLLRLLEKLQADLSLFVAPNGSPPAPHLLKEWSEQIEQALTDIA